MGAVTTGILVLFSFMNIILTFFEIGWNRNNRVAYNIYVGWNSSAPCKTWECMQNVMVAYNLNLLQLSNIGENYAQMARQTFILYQV